MKRAQCTVVASLLLGTASGASYAAPASTAYLNLPIEISFPALDKMLARQLPPSLEGQDSQYGFQIDYQVVLRGIRVDPRGDIIRTEADFEYSAQACKELGPLGCKHVASCDQQQVTATIETRVALASDWGVELTTRALPVTHRTRCVVTPLQIDITSQIVGVLQSELERATGDIDARVGQKLRFQKQAEAVWSRLAKPRRLGKGHDLWLVLDIDSVAAGPIALSKTSAAVDLQIGMSPELHLSPPKPRTDLPPLTRLRTKDITPGFRGDVTVQIALTDLDHLLRVPASGIEIDLGGKGGKVNIARLDVAPARGKLAVAVGFRQPRGLSAKLEIQPRFDSRDNRIGFEATSVSLSGARPSLPKKLLEQQIRALIGAQTVALSPYTDPLSGRVEKIPVDRSRAVAVAFDKVSVQSVAVSDAGIELVLRIAGSVELGADKR